jgi:hypothetical protein
MTDCHPGGSNAVEGVSVGTPRPVIEHAMRPGRHELADVLAIQELLASHG